jgi:hypothetical protein
MPPSSNENLKSFLQLFTFTQTVLEINKALQQLTALKYNDTMGTFPCGHTWK